MPRRPFLHVIACAVLQGSGYKYGRRGQGVLLGPSHPPHQLHLAGTLKISPCNPLNIRVKRSEAYHTEAAAKLPGYNTSNQIRSTDMVSI
jgi:hypothetical protein